MEGPPVVAGGSSPCPVSADNRNRRSPSERAEGDQDAIDGLRCLAQQDLGRGVADDGFAQLEAEDIAHVLGGHGQPGPVLARGFRRPPEEISARGCCIKSHTSSTTHN